MLHAGTRRRQGRGAGNRGGMPQRGAVQVPTAIGVLPQPSQLRAQPGVGPGAHVRRPRDFDAEEARAERNGDACGGSRPGRRIKSERSREEGLSRGARCSAPSGRSLVARSACAAGRSGTSFAMMYHVPR